jgi:hypothetical protein
LEEGNFRLEANVAKTRTHPGFFPFMLVMELELMLLQERIILIAAFQPAGQGIENKARSSSARDIVDVRLIFMILTKFMILTNGHDHNNGNYTSF